MLLCNCVFLQASTYVQRHIVSYLLGRWWFVSHKRLDQSWKQTSICLLVTVHTSRSTTKYFKIYKISLDTNMKRNIYTQNARRNKMTIHARPHISLLMKSSSTCQCATGAIYTLTASPDSPPPLFFFFWGGGNPAPGGWISGWHFGSNQV